MKRAIFTIKNYRGFSDTEPARIEIGPGFTALLGRNNSGKSALKLFFYELRQLLSFFTQKEPHVIPNMYQIFAPGAVILTNYNGITDVEEIFNNSNSRPLSFEIDIIQPENYNTRGADCLKRIVATCDRSSPQHWRFASFGLHKPALELASSNPNPSGLATPRPQYINHPQQGESDCTDFITIAESLRDARYYGPFRNAINQGSGEHYDLRVGTSFIALWNEWKTSGSKSKTRAIDQITEDIRALFEFSRLEINASMALNTLIVSIDGNPYRLNELGSGLAQFIMVLGNAATSRPSFLLIDEPETNLHPALQIDFLLAMAQYAREGVMFSTHSVGLARSVAERIYSLQKKADRTVVRPFEATPNYLEFIGELSFSTFKELGCDRLLLVEGVNDVKVMQQFLRLVKKEHTTVILPLGGDQLACGGREPELQELRRLSSKIRAIVDSESKDAGSGPSERRRKFVDTCRRIGIDVCVTERRAIENYFTNRAVKAALGDAYESLGPYDLLKECKNPWGKADNWKIARQMQLDELAGTDIRNFIERM